MSALPIQARTTVPVTKVLDEKRQWCQLHKGLCKEVNWVCYGIEYHIMACQKCINILRKARLVKKGRDVAGHHTWLINVPIPASRFKPLQRKPYILEMTPEDVVVARALGFRVVKEID